MVSVRFDVQAPSSLTSKAPLASGKKLNALLGEVALEVERRAKSKAPVDTGRMRSAIHAFRVSDSEHGVAVGVLYAVFVEFGTGVRGQATNQAGTPVGYDYGNVIGMVSQPFLRPALYEVRPLVKGMV